MKLIGSPAQDVRHAQCVVCETQRQQGVSYRHEGADLDSQKCEEQAARGPWPCLRTPEKLRVWTGAWSDRSGGPVSAVARAGRPDLVHHSVSDMMPQGYGGGSS